jgi:hypothetical protein
MGVNDRPHPRSGDWLSGTAHGVGNWPRTGGGGPPRNPGLYQLSMMAGLLIFTALGWRIVAELGRIRRALNLPSLLPPAEGGR